MNIEYLREFLAIHRHQRLSDAADELFTTSSSLSKHMSALEDELGVSLFKKVHRYSVVNEFGQLIIPYAQEIVRQMDEMQKALEEKQEADQDTLQVVSHYRIIEEALEFRKQYGIHVVIRESQSGRDLLDDGTCEAGFLIRNKDDESGMETIPYKKERLVFICSRNHRLADRTSVTIKDVKKEPFVMFPMTDKSPLAALIFEQFEQADCKPKIVSTARVGSTIAMLVAQGAGVAFLWEKALLPVMQEGLCAIPYEPTKEIEVDICWPAGTKLSPKAAKFIDFMKSRVDHT